MLYTSNDTATRLAVTETLYRFAAGIDLKDNALLASSFAENVVSDFRPAATKAGFDYPVLPGRDTIVAALANSLSPLDSTHSVNRVTDDKAQREAIGEAQHVPKSDPCGSFTLRAGGLCLSGNHAPGISACAINQ